MKSKTPVILSVMQYRQNRLESGFRLFKCRRIFSNVGHSSWLQIKGTGFDPRRYQIFWEAVGLQRGSLSLARIIEELFEGNSGSGLKNRD
jgi:hypothetical protein